MKHHFIHLIVLLCALSAFSTTYYVDASRPDDSGSATNWATAKQTIQSAVDLASAGDTVLVTNGVYDIGGKPAVCHTLTNRVITGEHILLQSTSGPELTFICGEEGTDEKEHTNAVRGVFLQFGATLSGFTIMDGHTVEWSENDSDRSGGGIWADVGRVVTNCIIN